MRSETAVDRPRAAGRDEFPPQRVRWSVAEGFTLFVLFLVIHSVSAGLAPRSAPEQAGPAMQIALSNAAVLLMIYAFLRRRTGSFTDAAEAIGLRVRSPWRTLWRSVGPLAVGVVALLGWGALQAHVMKLTGWEPVEQETVRWIRARAQAGASLEVGVVAFLAVAVAPVTEELLFRGALYLPLRGRLGRVPAALAVSVLFAAVHAYLAGLGHLLILALVFTWMMESTGTIVAPILAHVAHNAAMVALILK